MKAKFNKNWNKSKQPRKQRKFLANAPNHIKRKLLGATLDKGLRKNYGVKSIGVRKGDGVKIMRGRFKGKRGKIEVVDVKKTRVQVAGAQRAKMGGEKLETWFHPSNVMIVSLNDSDEKRFKREKIIKEKKEDVNREKDSKNKTKEKKDAHKKE